MGRKGGNKQLGKNPYRQKPAGYKYQKYNLKKDFENHLQHNVQPKSDETVPKQQLSNLKKERAKKARLEGIGLLQLPNLNQYFLFELFILQQRIDLENHIEIAPESEYVAIETDLLLTNLFLKKFRLDPGFRMQIYLELDKNTSIQRKATRDILKLFEEKQIFNPVKDLTKADKDDFDLYKKGFEVTDVTEPRYNYIFKSPFILDEIKSQFFFQLWKDLMIKGQKSQAVACESLLFEFFQEYHNGSFLFRTSSPFEKNQNTMAYHLQAMNKVTQNLDYRFLDYIEAERDNLVICEEMQQILNALNFPNITAAVNTILDHFVDIAQEKPNPITIRQVPIDILTILALTYFQSLNFDSKIKLLNPFYGIEFVVNNIRKDEKLYPIKYLIEDLPNWFQSGFLPELKPFLEEVLYREDKKLEEYHRLILIKYICKSLLDTGNSTESLSFLYKNYPILVEWKNSGFINTQSVIQDTRILIELFNLISEIASSGGLSFDFLYAIKSLKEIIKNTKEKQEKIKFLILLSTCFRRNQNFETEREILEPLQLNLQSLKHEKDVDENEILEFHLPAKFLASENKDPTQIPREAIKQRSLLVFENKSLLSLTYERCYLYGNLRKKFFHRPNSIQNAAIHEDRIKYHTHVDQAIQANLMASFRQALRCADKAKGYFNAIDNDKEKDIFYESQIFSHLYLGQGDQSKYFLEQGIANRPQDSYYLKYLTFICLQQKDYPATTSHIIHLYKLEQSESIAPQFNLKALFQLIIEWAGFQRFQQEVKVLLTTLPIGGFTGDALARVYFDIALAIADLGYSKPALDYFNDALNVVQEQILKIGILNGIGTVYCDLQQIDAAISIFQQVIPLKPDFISSHFNLAKMFEMKQDFLSAKQVLLAAKQFFMKDPAVLAVLDGNIVRMNLFIAGLININLVHNTVAIAHFKTAHQLISNINALKYLTDNTGLIFVSLGNGLDCVLHASMTQLILKFLESQYGPNKKIPHLQQGIREIWGGKQENKHMSLGKWPFVIRDMMGLDEEGNSNPDPNPLMLDLRIKQFSLLNEDDLKNIETVTQILADYRNPGGHGHLIDFTKFSKIIPEIIEGINKVVAIADKIFHTLSITHKQISV